MKVSVARLFDREPANAVKQIGLCPPGLRHAINDLAYAAPAHAHQR